MDCLCEVSGKTLQNVQEHTALEAIKSLESGKILFLPDYVYSLLPEETSLLSESILDSNHKNISYDYTRQRLAGLATENSNLASASLMQPFMHRFAEFSRQLVTTLLPQYTDEIRWGRTSYRPAEIKGRVSSKRRDDTRLHVDSFSATPVNGLRILRVFCNINPYQQPRVWHVGEPFPKVLNTFSKQIPAFNLMRAKLLNLIKVTKTLRSPYDHYMLNLHDRMKLDDNYQQSVSKQRVDFPAQSTWIVFTDHVSHAALGGQYLLEQTFYLPVAAMVDPHLSPLKQWEKEKKTALI